MAKKRDWKRIVRYSLLGMLFYLFFLYLTFPTNLIKDRVLGSVSKASGIPLHAKEVSLGLFSGISLRGLETQFKQQPLKLEQVNFRPSLLSLITGRQAGSFKVRSKGLRFSGSFSKGKENLSFDLNSQEVELTKLLQLLGQKDLRLQGKLRGKVKLSGPEKEIAQQNFSKAKGNISLQIPKPVIEGGNITLPRNNALGPLSGMPFVLPKTIFENCSFKGKLANGKFDLQNFVLQGKDLSAKASGQIKLAERLNLSQLDLQTDITLGDKYSKMLAPFKTGLPKGVKLSGNKLSLKLAGTLRNPFIKSQ